jgi:predicted enzyme related to lactoylglutathione lyase
VPLLAYFDRANSATDTTAPTVQVVSVSRTRIGRTAGFDSAVVTWTSDEDFAHYQIRVVATATDPVTQGVLVEADQNPPSGGLAGVQYQSMVTDPELEAVSPLEGTKTLKVFTADAAGNWSS